MKQALLLVLLALLLSSCTAYPRYKAYAPVTPERRDKEPPALTTNSFLRLGSILQRYLGEPYQSSLKYHEGVDCSRFVQKVYSEFNKTRLPRTVIDQIEYGQPVARRMKQFGDLIFFETVRGRPSHVGIYVGYNEFIHASSTRGVIISRLENPYWAERLTAIRRVLK